ncbi:MAG: DUF4388 domain-containing protein [Nannocystaceae bacterium]
MVQEPNQGGSRSVALERVSPPRLFFALLRRRFSGALHLEQPTPEPVARTVWFHGGMPVYTDWASERDLLGEVLIGEGLITPAQCDQGLSVKAAEGGPLGEILQRLECIDGAGLSRGMSRQCARKLAHVFELRGGNVGLEPGASPPGNDASHRHPVNVLRLIHDGVAAYYDELRLRAELGAVLSGHVAATGVFGRYRGHFSFAASLDPTLDALTRGAVAERLLGQGPSPLLVMRTIYCAWACQMLELGPRAAESEATEASTESTATEGRAENTANTAKSSPRINKPTDRALADVTPSGGTGTTKAATPSVRRGAPEHAAYEAELAKLEAQVASDAHAFGLFSLEIDASRKDIRQAWADLSRKFHPDALAAEGRFYLRDRVQRVFAAVSEAYSVLSDKDARAKLKAALAIRPDAGRELDPATIVRNAFQAEFETRDGDKLVKAGSYARALEAYERSLVFSPDEIDVIAAAQWCRFQLTPRNRDDAQRAASVLDSAVASQPSCARAHYYLGLVRLHLGLERMALVSFDTAHEADPKLIDAERQAHAIRIKNKEKTKARGKKSFGLRGLFGRRSD